MITGEWLFFLVLNSLLVALLRAAALGQILSALVVGFLTLALYHAGQQGGGAHVGAPWRWLPSVLVGAGWWWWALAPL